MSARHKALIALIIAHVIWGGSTPIIKLTISSIPPFSLATLRFWLTAVIMIIYLIARRQHISIAQNDITKVLAWAFLAVPVNIALFFWGLQFTTSIDAAVIGSLVPIFTALAAYFFLGEHFFRVNILGIGIAFIGSLVIIGSPLFNLATGDGSRFFGNLLNLLAALAWVAATLIARKIMHKYNAAVLTTIGFVVGFFVLLPFLFMEYQQNPQWIYHLSVASYLGLSYVILGNSILAYTLFNFALTYVSATAANTASYLMPVVALAIAIPLLGEKLTLPFVIGSTIIAVGVFLAETRHALHPLHKSDGL